MNDLPNSYKDSFSKLEKTIKTKHILEIIREFESLLQKIIKNEKISCETNCLMEVKKPTNDFIEKIKVNLVIPNQIQPKIFVIIKIITDTPEVLTNYMVEAMMLSEYYRDDVKLIYVFHDINIPEFKENTFQSLIKGMKEQKHIDALLFLPKDLKNFLELIKT